MGVYIYIYVHTYIYIYTHTQVSIYFHTYTYLHLHVYVCVHACTCIVSVLCNPSRRIPESGRVELSNARNIQIPTAHGLGFRAEPTIEEVYPMPVTQATDTMHREPRVHLVEAPSLVTFCQIVPKLRTLA